MMIAIGMSLVIATGGIDLSVGSLMAVAGAVSMEFLNAAGDSASVGVAFAAAGLALLITAVLGAVNGVLVAYRRAATLHRHARADAGRPRNREGHHGRAEHRGIQRPLPVDLQRLPSSASPSCSSSPSLIVIVVGWVVRRSALGLMIEAIGINPKASRMAGIKPKGLLLTTYILSGILAGIAGIMSVGSVMTVDISRTGYQLELDAILAVVIGGASLAGGKFSLSGAFVGALLIATLDKTVLFLGVSSSATPAFKAIVIVVLCLLQSERVRSWFRTRRKETPAARRAEDRERGGAA